MNRKPQLNASNKRYIYSMKNILIILCLLFISATGSAQKFNIFVIPAGVNNTNAAKIEKHGQCSQPFKMAFKFLLKWQKLF